MSDEYIGM